jgi:hypothetical protein
MATKTRHLRRTALLLVKLALAVAILAYLIGQVQHHEGFSRLIQQPKIWSLLVLALVCTFAAIVLSFIRWYMLVVALGLDFRLVDALRLGSIGFVLNFVALGTLGGDLFKAVFLAREQPGKRTEAVATVMADRLLGLLTMLLLASSGILITGLRHSDSLPIAMLCNVILLATVVGWTGVGLLLFVPGLLSPRLIGWVEAVILSGGQRIAGPRAVVHPAHDDRASGQYGRRDPGHAEWAGHDGSDCRSALSGGARQNTGPARRRHHGLAWPADDDDYGRAGGAAILCDSKVEIAGHAGRGGGDGGSVSR